MQENLKIPQIRVLLVLARGAVLPRATLSERCGLSPLSGTVTRVLNGLREGSSSGAAHLGLVGRGMIEAVVLDVDGVKEQGYRITAKGKRELELWLEINELPAKLRDAAASTNIRYKGGDDAESG